MYHLEVQAVDNTGERNQQEIQIAVGNVSKDAKADWRNEIYQVILNEGEKLMLGDVREFPRLECFLTINAEGSLILLRGSPGKSNGFVWKTSGKADRPTPQPVLPRFYAVMRNGRLGLYRTYPGKPELGIFETRSVSEPGSYKLGITASKRLAVFREEGTRSKIVWMSPVPKNNSGNDDE